MSTRVNNRMALRLLGVGVRLAGGGYNGPYGNIPSIAAAYGMRRLLTSYTGNLLRLRRSNDNAESDFSFASSGNLDTAAIATWLGANSGYVVTWYDQSGNSNNATQSTAASQPGYSASGYLTFDGSNDYLDTGVVPGAGWSMAARSNNNARDTFSCIVGQRGASSDRMFGLLEYASGHRYEVGDKFVATSDTSVGGVYAIAGNLGYRDGVLAATLSGVTWTGAATTLYIGASHNVSSSSYLYSGDIYEIIISDTTYTAQQMADIYTIMEAA